MKARQVPLKTRQKLSNHIVPSMKMLTIPPLEKAVNWFTDQWNCPLGVAFGMVCLLVTLLSRRPHAVALQAMYWYNWRRFFFFRE